MKTILKFASWFVLVVVMLISVLMLFEPTLMSVENAMRVYGIAALAILIALCVTERILILGPFFIVVIYAVVSSFGYDILVLFYGDDMYEQIRSIRHAYTEYFNQANALCLIGLFSMLVGSVSFCSKPSFANQSEFFSYAEKRAYVRVSLLILWIFLFYMLVSLFTGTLRLTNYAEVKEWMSLQPFFMYALRFVWIAIPTYIFFSDRVIKWEFVVPLALISAILIFSGNRNEAMYPLAMGVGVYVWKRIRVHGGSIPVWIVPASLFVVFVLNPLISSVRNTGLDLETLLGGSFGFKEALLELGQQINPFSISLYAMDKCGYEFQFGMTILAPCMAILSLGMLLSTSAYLSSNMNPIFVLERLGHSGRGYNIFAEMYVNFGVLASSLALFGMGMISSRCENGRKLDRFTLLYFQLSPVIMLWVRNTFMFNITIVIFALIINIVIYILFNNKHKLMNI